MMGLSAIFIIMKRWNYYCYDWYHYHYDCCLLVCFSWYHCCPAFEYHQHCSYYLLLEALKLLGLQISTTAGATTSEFKSDWDEAWFRVWLQVKVK